LEARGLRKDHNETIYIMGHMQKYKGVFGCWDVGLKKNEVNKLLKLV